MSGFIFPAILGFKILYNTIFIYKYSASASISNPDIVHFVVFNKTTYSKLFQTLELFGTFLNSKVSAQ